MDLPSTVYVIGIFVVSLLLIISSGIAMRCLDKAKNKGTDRTTSQLFLWISVPACAISLAILGYRGYQAINRATPAAAAGPLPSSSVSA
jgi:hypothetical protein